ncbi:hypothetical protein GCM10027170_04100 [Aliiglaciecola aliphaticivorans]
MSKGSHLIAKLKILELKKLKPKGLMIFTLFKYLENKVHHGIAKKFTVRTIPTIHGTTRLCAVDFAIN